MANEVEVNDNSKEALEAIKRKTRAALDTIGSMCVGFAIDIVPVDTGRLKNSLTWAISGEEPATKDYGPNGGAKDGHYSGVAPDDKDLSVYIGTNVSYATAVELGEGNRRPKPYLCPAATNHISEIKTKIKEIFGDDVASNLF